MLSRTRYRLKQHHKFEQNDQKYVADLETGDIVQINDIEWKILSRYESQTHHRIVEALKKEYKLTAIFDGIERLERLGKQDLLLQPTVENVAVRSPHPYRDRKPKLLVPLPFHQGEIGVRLRHKSQPLSVFEAPRRVRRVGNLIFS